MWELRNPIKTPLTILTFAFGYSVFAGVFGWETDQGAAFLIGLAELGSIMWMWVVYNT